MDNWTPWEDTECLSNIAGTHSVATRPKIPDYPTVRSSSAKIMMSASEVRDSLEAGDIAEVSLALTDLLLNTIMCAQECGIPLGITWDAMLQEIVAHSTQEIPLDKEALISTMTALYHGG